MAYLRLLGSEGEGQHADISYWLSLFINRLWYDRIVSYCTECRSRDVSMAQKVRDAE